MVKKIVIINRLLSLFLFLTAGYAYNDYKQRTEAFGPVYYETVTIDNSTFIREIRTQSALTATGFYMFSAILIMVSANRISNSVEFEIMKPVGDPKYDEEVDGLHIRFPGNTPEFWSLEFVGNIIAVRLNDLSIEFPMAQIPLSTHITHLVGLFDKYPCFSKYSSAEKCHDSCPLTELCKMLVEGDS